MHDPPFTPGTLAKRWGCSPAHIRKMIRGGWLRAIRLGDKVIRIPVNVVEEYEQCGSAGTEKDTTPSGETTAPKGARCVPRIVSSPNRNSPTS